MKLNLNKNRINFYPKIKKIIAFLALLVFIFFILNLTGYSNNLKEFFFSISLPVQKTFWRGGKNISTFFAAIMEAKTLKQELNNLYSKNQQILSQLAILAELEKENKVLKQALNLGLEKDFQLILVQVTSKDVSRDSILINKGKNDGLARGYPVITKERILLGRIGQVYNNFSEVILISNKESSFDAKTTLINREEEKNNNEEHEKEEVYGIVKGEKNLKIYFDLIPEDKEIFEGQLVVTSVLGGVYPEGLLVGRIKTIGKSEIEIFQKAELDPGFRISSLDYLFVIKDF